MLQKIHRLIFKQSIVRFVVIGGLNTLIDFGLFNILILSGYTSLIYLFGQPFLVANILSVSAAMIHSFIMNQSWVFGVPESKRNKRQLVLFILFTVAGAFIVNQVSFSILYGFINTDSVMLLNVIKVSTNVLLVITNFLVYRNIVFSYKADKSTK